MRSKASYQQLQYFTAGTTFSGTFDCGVASMGLLQQTSQFTLRTYSSYFIQQPKRSMKRSYVKGSTPGMPHLKHTTCKRSILMYPPRSGGGFLKSTTNTTHTAGWQTTSRRVSTDMHTQIQVYAQLIIVFIGTETEVIMLPSLSLVKWIFTCGIEPG